MTSVLTDEERSLLTKVDGFIQKLFEKLQKPNSSLFGGPSAPKDGDVNYPKCVNGVKYYIGNVLPLRAVISSPAPSQYEGLRALLSSRIGSTSLKQKYSDEKTEFFDKISKLLFVISGGDTVDCGKYGEVTKLFSESDTKGISSALVAYMSKIKQKEEKKEVDRQIGMLKERELLEFGDKFPSVPTTTPRIGRSRRKLQKRSKKVKKTRKVRRM